MMLRFFDLPEVFFFVILSLLFSYRPCYASKIVSFRGTQKSFILNKYICIFRLDTSLSFSCKKGEFYRCFNRLNQPVKKSRPAGRPDRYRSTRVVSISEVDIKNKLPLTKIGGATMGVSSQNGPFKVLFNLLSKTHEIFKVSQ